MECMHFKNIKSLAFNGLNFFMKGNCVTTGKRSIDTLPFAQSKFNSKGHILQIFPTH